MSKETFKNKSTLNTPNESNIRITIPVCYDKPMSSIIKKSFGDPNILLYRPVFHTSTDFKNWIATLDMRICVICRKMHGKVYYIYEKPEYELPIHDFCRCIIENMKAAFIGTATKDGENGTDVYLSTTGKLPSCYITKKEAQKLGWINFLGNLNAVAPDKIIGGDIYQNRNGHLPSSSGRVWYEADINYDKGYRNHDRIIYSNDGLIFATYDHYQTFVQIH